MPGTIAVAPDGTVGMAYYGRASLSSPWYVYAAEIDGCEMTSTIASTEVPVGTSADEYFGGPPSIAFGPDGKMHLGFARAGRHPVVPANPFLPNDNLDIFYVRER